VAYSSMLDQSLVITSDEALQRQVPEAVPLQVCQSPETATVCAAAVADAKHERAATACCHQLSRVVRAGDDQRIRTF
jgi:hypothetical protein